MRIAFRASGTEFVIRSFGAEMKTTLIAAYILFCMTGILTAQQTPDSLILASFNNSSRFSGDKFIRTLASTPAMLGNNN